MFTFSGGRACATFQEACEVRGLVDTDASLDKCLEEAAKWQMTYSLRRLFAIIMVFCEASNIHYLWDKHIESMSEDYHRTMSNNLKCVQQMVLKDTDDILSSMDKDIHDYGLPELDDQDPEHGYHNREVREQYSLGVNDSDLSCVQNLNPEQLSGYTEIIDHMINRKGRVFFVDGPGGTGKTFFMDA
jgi:hypothetical protein